MRLPRVRNAFVLICAVVVASSILPGIARPAFAISLFHLVTEPASDGTAVDLPKEGEEPYAAVPATVLTEEIDRLLDGEAGVYGIVLMEPDGTVLYRRNSEVPFVAASLYKLVLMAEIGRMVDAGELPLDLPLYVAPEYYNSIDGTDSYFDPAYAGFSTTVDEALFATGAYSSNVAAKALLSVTTMDAVNGAAKELGLTQTSLFVAPKENSQFPPTLSLDSTVQDIATAEALVLSYATDGQVNLTTPHDMAKFMEMLLAGRVFNERVSRMILDILNEQVVTNRLPALLPEETEIAHKTGNLDHVIHDVGVIYCEDGPIILAALSQATPDDGRAANVIQRLALIAYGETDIPPILASPVAGASPVASPWAVPVISSDGTDVEAD